MPFQGLVIGELVKHVTGIFWLVLGVVLFSKDELSQIILGYYVIRILMLTYLPVSRGMSLDSLVFVSFTVPYGGCPQCFSTFMTPLLLAFPHNIRVCRQIYLFDLFDTLKPSIFEWMEMMRSSKRNWYPQVDHVFPNMHRNGDVHPFYV